MLLFDRLTYIAAADPDRIALDALDGTSLSYGGLMTAVQARAEALREQLPAGSPVVIQRDYGIQTAIDELALLHAAIPVLSLPAFFTKDQARHAISLCDALPDPASRPSGRASARRSTPPPLACGTARITFTSGSTGSPKGICLAADHMFGVADSIVRAVGAEHAGRHLALLPPGILLETVAGFFPTLLAGGCYVCPPQAAIGMGDPFRPDFARALTVIATGGITSLILVPEYLEGLVCAMEAGGVHLSAMTLVAVGGARVSPDLMARARALGLPVRQGYGLTECASVVSLQAPDDADDGSVGQLLGHMRARIAEDGEIVLEGPLCLGAIGGEAPSTPFHTGDLGTIDDAGRLHVRGRKSNLIITSFGRNISPEWIESALTAQPDIAQAMVHGDGQPHLSALLVPARPDADLAAAGFGLANPERLNDDREYRVIDQELRLSGKRGRIRWLAGLSYVDASQLLTLDLQSATGAGLQIDRHRRSTRDLALFGDLGIPLTDRLVLDLGGRVFNTKVSDSRLGLVRTEEEREGRSGFTPSMALSWSPGGNRLAYLRYGSAFRQGGADFSRAGAPARNLKGDELATIEAGWRQQTGRVRLEAGTWYTIWENIQSDVLGADGLVVTRNIGRGRSLGVEASMTVDPAPGWTAEAGLTFVQARLTRNDLGLALVDRRLPVVPDYVARLGVERHFSLPRGEAVLGLRARYVGPSALSFDPAINRPMGHLIEGQAEARIHWGMLDVTARIDNLFGEDEDMFAFGNALRFSTLRQFTPMAPRQITLAVSARF
jgi:acyl-CoA synthetase (AMP-forming)/AMP-acid ligase II